jgi:hypothetical protein
LFSLLVELDNWRFVFLGTNSPVGQFYMKQFSSDGSWIELQLISGKLLLVDPLLFERIQSAIGWLKVKSI